MPRQARDYEYRGNYGYVRPYPQVAAPTRPTTVPIRRATKVQQRKKKANPIASIVSFAMIAFFGLTVLPFVYERLAKPFFFGPSYKEVKVDTYSLLRPTSRYLANNLFLNQRSLESPKIKKPEMTTLYTTSKMPVLEAKLTKLMQSYKTIEPSVFVWDYDSGKFVDINASKLYSAASIIKIPVLIELFKSIEQNQLTIYDEMELTPYYKSPGSGNLQGQRTGAKYTIDQLARVMITQSDNTATNMIMSAVGSMTDVNSAIRRWGLKNTQVNAWLPDMAGTNYTTARDLATMLYNLDNPGFLNINSREYIIDYMSHVENNRLIQAGLGQGALFIHKTGDIGKMLGDAGIVFTPSGKKYICVIMANRPYNSPLGKDFIQKASNIIYQSMTSGAY